MVQYLKKNEGFYVEKRGVEIQLSNFTAEIVLDTVFDDGDGPKRRWGLIAEVGGQTAEFTVSAATFDRMDWIAEHLGPRAVWFPGYQHREHLCIAIKTASNAIKKESVYGHTGWVYLDGNWIYLHANGHIGPVSAGAGGTSFRTELPDSLQLYSLPAPQQKMEDARVNAAMFAAAFLFLGESKVVVPLLAAPLRAVLGIPVVSSLFGSGPSGVFKTEAFAIAQQCHGAGMDSQNLPSTFASTANAILAQTHCVKDAVQVIDDQCPIAGDQLRQHKDADQLFRSVGNRAARNRLAGNGQLKPQKRPSGYVLANGEDVPRGESLNARILHIAFTDESINPAQLGWCQRHAREGSFAACIANFIAWLQPQLSKVHAHYEEERQRWRSGNSGGRHRRTFPAVCDLNYGLYWFGKYLKAIEFSEEMLAKLKNTWEEGMWELFESQDKFLKTSDPVDLTVKLLASLLASKRVHVANLAGDSPHNPEAFGYRPIKVVRPHINKGDEQDDNEQGDLEMTVWQASGRRIGWTNDTALFLNPEETYNQVRAMSRHIGNELNLSLRAWIKQLVRRGIVEPDRQRGRNCVRITAEGVRHRTLFIPTHHVQWLDVWGKDSEEWAEYQQHIKNIGIDAILDC